MSGFFARILQNVANELITKKLVNSPTFQRFAYKTVTGVRPVCAGCAETGAPRRAPMQVKNLKDVAADKGVDSLKSVVEKGATGAGHAKGFLGEVKDGITADWAAIASKFTRK